MIVRHTRRALADLEAIRSYIAARSPGGAQRVLATIDRITAGLADFPEKGQSTDRKGVRRLVATPYPYLIFYRVRREEVEVIHVRYARRRPWRPHL